MGDFLQEINKQADAVCKELLAAKRAAKENKGVKAAYQKGRAEELEKWLHSLEALIEKITERRTQKNETN